MRAAEDICGPKEGNTWRGRPGGGMKRTGEPEKEKGCIQEKADAGWKRTEGGL